LFNTVFDWQVYKFEENYEAALAGFAHAGKLDPGWREPRVQEERLLSYLAAVQEMVDAKVGAQYLTYRFRWLPKW